MARTMTVDVGDELHEKQAESRLQELVSVNGAPY